MSSPSTFCHLILLMWKPYHENFSTISLKTLKSSTFRELKLTFQKENFKNCKIFLSISNWECIWGFLLVMIRLSNFSKVLFCSFPAQVSFIFVYDLWSIVYGVLIWCSFWLQRWLFKQFLPFPSNPKWGYKEGHASIGPTLFILTDVIMGQVG